jgi:hypothetical protein
MITSEPLEPTSTYLSLTEMPAANGRRIVITVIVGALVVGALAGVVWTYARVSSLSDQLGQAQQSLATTTESLTTVTRRADEATLRASGAERDAAVAASQAQSSAVAAQNAAQGARDCNAWITGFKFYNSQYSDVLDIYGKAIKGNWTYAQFGSAVNEAMTPFLNMKPPEVTDQQKTSCLNYAADGGS